MYTLYMEAIAKEILNDIEYFEFAGKFQKGDFEAAREILLRVVDRDVVCCRMSPLDGMVIYNELDLSPDRAAEFPQPEQLLGPAL